MKVSELAEFDASKYLKDENDYRLYLAHAFEGGDPVEIQVSLGDITKARGMTALARESGIAREALYRALPKKGNAEFATIMKVIGAMGLQPFDRSCESQPRLEHGNSDTPVRSNPNPQIESR
ncbi:putative addiction module antidote protein [Trinickia dabaoshanensis]|uniref:Putative addiction module antidote protein n=1 Tax=Trinickia dabaoshanensis TaxID=564714 RepID=A0A2N7VKG0_9BURK|nr:addiction module antidote protein [Trinickia dabaoshanensis]PMS17613.1 putative addiction module antidote protein [Trinickia dabaoshanensis]